MKIKDGNIESIVVGETKSKRFSISDSKIIYDILRNKLYKDPIGAICREIASNSRDANREAKRGNVPITIEIVTSGLDALGISSNLSIAFHDSGLGITPDRMDDIFIVYGESTKRDTNEQTGGYGLGAKTPFAYSDTFSVKTVCDFEGKRMKYFYVAAIDKEEKGMMYLFRTEETTDPTGTTVTVPIKNQQDRDRFETSCVNYTQAWDVLPLYKNFRRTNNNVERQKFGGFELWYSDRDIFTNCDNVVILIDGIPYPYPGEHLPSAMQNIFGTLVIPFENGVFDLSGGREEIQYIKTNITILDKRWISIRDYASTWLKDFVDTAPNFRQAALKYTMMINRDKLSYSDLEMKIASSMNSMSGSRPQWRGKNLAELFLCNPERLHTTSMYFISSEEWNSLHRKTIYTQEVIRDNFFDAVLTMRACVAAKDKVTAYTFDKCSARTQRVHTLFENGSAGVLFVQRHSEEEFDKAHGWDEKKKNKYKEFYNDESALVDEFIVLKNIGEVEPTPYGEKKVSEKRETLTLHYRKYNTYKEGSLSSISYSNKKVQIIPKKDKLEKTIVFNARSIGKNESTGLNSNILKFMIGTAVVTGYKVTAASRSYNTMIKIGAITPEQYLKTITDEDIYKMRKVYSWNSISDTTLRASLMADKLLFDEEDLENLQIISGGVDVRPEDMKIFSTALRAGQYEDLTKDLYKTIQNVGVVAIPQAFEEKYPMLKICSALIHDDDDDPLVVSEESVEKINQYLKLVQDARKHKILSGGREQHDHVDA